MTAHRATPMTGHEAFCLAKADHFVAVRGRTPRDRSRETFATLALAPRLWRVALFGTAGWVALHGHENLTYCALNGSPENQTFPVTDIEHAELEAFAAAVAGGPAYPLPLDEAVHGVSVYETMIQAAASGSAYAVA